MAVRRKPVTTVKFVDTYNWPRFATGRSAPPPSTSYLGMWSKDMAMMHAPFKTGKENHHKHEKEMRFMRQPLPTVGGMESSTYKARGREGKKKEADGAGKRREEDGCNAQFDY